MVSTTLLEITTRLTECCLYVALRVPDLSTVFYGIASCFSPLLAIFLSHSLLCHQNVGVWVSSRLWTTCFFLSTTHPLFHSPFNSLTCVSCLGLSPTPVLCLQRPWICHHFTTCALYLLSLVSLMAVPRQWLWLYPFLSQDSGWGAHRSLTVSQSCLPCCNQSPSLHTVPDHPRAPHATARLCFLP